MPAPPLEIREIYVSALPVRAQSLGQLADTWLRFIARQASL